MGTKEDEALKDAFRSAVSTVVGTVVDAETLIKNDEVISDQILTYSNGFIKTYEVLKSQTLENGLVQVRIKAIVEKRTLVAKLTKANVVVKDVDGKGLWATAVSQLDEQRKATQLLEKAFEGFPCNCIHAEVIGDPTILSKNDNDATLQIRVRFRIDSSAYKQFSSRLCATLDAVSKKKGSFSLYFQFDPNSQSNKCGLNGVPQARTAVWATKVPQAFALSQPGRRAGGLSYRKEAVIAVYTHTRKEDGLTTWRYYVLDEASKSIFESRIVSDNALSVRRGTGLGGLGGRGTGLGGLGGRGDYKKTYTSASAQIVVVDEKGSTLTTEAVPLWVHMEPGNKLPGRTRERPEPGAVASRGFDIPINVITPAMTAADHGGGLGHTGGLFIVSPFFFNFQTKYFEFLPEVVIDRSITVPLDTLKEIKQVKATVAFDQ
jgi:hypothetical protein